MYAYFTLATVPARRTVPNTGETLAAMLLRAADEQAAAMEGKSQPGWFVEIAAQLYYLAADALDDASARSIGHKRSERYEEQAREARAKADKMVTEARARDAAKEAARDAARDAA